MFVGRNLWKSSLLESEKSEISLSSSNAVISLIDASQLIGLRENGLVAFAFDCSLVQDEQVCQQVHLQVTRLSMPSELITRAIDNTPPTHTSNSHLFSYRVNHGGSATVNSIVVVSVLSFVGLSTMMCPMLPNSHMCLLAY